MKFLKKILPTFLIFFLAFYLFLNNWLPGFLNAGKLESVYVGDLWVENEQGKKVFLKDYAGETLILSFWASWCPPCKVEIPMLNAVSDSLRDDNKVLIGVNLGETWPKINRFRETQEMNFKVVRSSEQLAETLKVSQIPALVIIDRDSKVDNIIYGFRPWVQPYLMWWID